MDKRYWVATYKEQDSNELNTSFGCIGGFIYKTIGEAINAIKNDMEEYKRGLTGSIRVEEDDEEYLFCMYENGKIVCTWQPQLMRMAE
jgi:hypothetical protein